MLVIFRVELWYSILGLDVHQHSLKVLRSAHINIANKAHNVAVISYVDIVLWSRQIRQVFWILKLARLLRTYANANCTINLRKIVQKYNTVIGYWSHAAALCQDHSAATSSRAVSPVTTG